MPTPLSSLNPRLSGILRKDSGEVVSFDCPHCTPQGRTHPVTVNLVNPLDGEPAAPFVGQGSMPGWTAEGDLQTLSLTPSIDTACWHGWVEDGQVFDISEAPGSLQIAVVLKNGRIADQVNLALSPRQFAGLKDGRLRIGLVGDLSGPAHQI